MVLVFNRTHLKIGKECDNGQLPCTVLKNMPTFRKGCRNREPRSSSNQTETQNHPLTKKSGEINFCSGLRLYHDRLGLNSTHFLPTEQCRVLTISTTGT